MTDYEMRGRIKAMFKDMGDWSMSKDYNGAERFNDGGKPLIAETEIADVIICGIPHKDAVSVSVLPYNDCRYYEGEAPAKEAAEKIGGDIVNYITAADGLSVFFDGSFKRFFTGLPITGIRTDDPAE